MQGEFLSLHTILDSPACLYWGNPSRIHQGTLLVQTPYRAKREQCLNDELFYPLKEAQIMTERWRTHYNTVRPHGSLGGTPPAPETIQLAG